MVVVHEALPLQEAEQARNTLLELQSIASAVESSGQAKAEAQVITLQSLFIVSYHICKIS